MLFSLPPEVRLLIYRRSRFLVARERVQRKLSIRPVLHNLYNQWWSTYIASFRVTDEKYMHIEYFIGHSGDDIIVVDTCDYSRVALFLQVCADGRVVVGIGTEQSVRAAVRRPHVHAAASGTTTHIQWFSDRRVCTRES